MKNDIDTKLAAFFITNTMRGDLAFCPKGHVIHKDTRANYVFVTFKGMKLTAEAAELMLSVYRSTADKKTFTPLEWKRLHSISAGSYDTYHD